MAIIHGKLGAEKFLRRNHNIEDLPELRSKKQVCIRKRQGWYLMKKFYTWKLKKLMKIDRSHIAGAVGERKILERLRRLDDTHHVFCGLEIYGREVDFIIVGHGGVFSLEVKNYGKTSVKYKSGHAAHGALRSGQVLNRLLIANSLPFRVEDLLVNKRKKFELPEIPPRLRIITPSMLLRVVTEHYKLSGKEVANITSVLNKLI